MCRTNTKGVGVAGKHGAWLLGGLLLTVPLRGHANPQHDVPATRLSYVRAANAVECSPASALEREIAFRMGRDPFVGTPRQWIDGYIHRQGDFFEVELFERDASGKTLGMRQLHERGDDCRKLDEAIVLAVALIIDPTVQLAPKVSTTAPPATIGAVPTPTVERHPESTGSTTGITTRSATGTADPRTLTTDPIVTAGNRQKTELAAQHDATSTGMPKAQVPTRMTPAPSVTASRIGAASVCADAVLVHGALPGIAAGVELATSLFVDERGRYALRLSTLYLPETRSKVDAGTLGFGLTEMEAGFCVVRPGRRVAWHACAAFGIGAVHAVVHDPMPFAPGDRLWTAFRAEGGTALRLAGPFWLDARFFLLIPPRNWEFRVKGPGTDGQRAFLQSHVMPGAALGLTIAF